MKRFIFIIFFSLVLYPLFSGEKTLIDFSDPAFDNEMYGTWEIIFFPSLKKVEECSIKQVSAFDPVFNLNKDSKTNKANQNPETVMEVVITFSKVPEGTKGVLIRPSSKTSSLNNTIKNIGILKTISIILSCNNYSHGFGILLENHLKDQNIYLFSNLEFKGWKTLSWYNPNYITEVRKRELIKKTLFPPDMLCLKFAGFIIYYSEENSGSTLVLQCKEIRLKYDPDYPDFVLEEITVLQEAWDIK